MAGFRFISTLLRAKRHRATLLLLLLGAASGVNGQQAGPVPAWMQPQVLQAAAAMNMTEEQQAQFRTIVGEFATARVASIRKIVRRGDADQQRKIRSKTRGLLKKMEKQLSAVLTEEQQPAFDNYMQIFRSRLRG